MERRESGTTGALYALGAFGSWGFVPLYFKAVRHVGPLEVLAHRIVWALVLVSVFLVVRGRWPSVIAALRNPKVLGWLTLSAFLVAINWLVFIWAVFTDRVLETSLGYYINPLLNVVLGTLVLKERLRRFQAVAVGLATLGVAVLVLSSGTIPWAALTLGVSFACYGLVRKLVPVKAVVGMQIESLVLTPVALGYLVFLGSKNELAFLAAPGDALLLILSGAITALPLISFAEAAQRLTLTTLGFFQYLAPSVQFVLAVAVFREAFDLPHAIAFGFIWVALAVYSMEGRLDAWLGSRTPASVNPGAPR